ncbi:unannotated protein [freshwater metagenome]|uniref:Unannotated protein n=1 Tax=freshwater metagenome TaxID=449393 RepID=A0A6J6FWT0_9ZZZZ
MELREGSFRAPGSRERLLEVLLLSEDVTSSITHASRFDQQNLGVVSKQIKKNIWIIRVVIDQPGQPALHAIEHLTLGKSLPLLPPPRLGADENRSTFTHLLGGEEFATRKNRYLCHRNCCSLIGNRKLGEAINFIAPKIDTNGNIGRARVDVDD